jgi:hypothetical protein
MENLKLTTNLFPIVNVGMYDSLLSPDNLINDYEIDEDKDNEYIKFDSNEYWSNLFDISKFRAEILTLATDYIKDEIKPILTGLKLGISDIETVSINSPRFYNYGSDELYFDLIVEDQFNNNIIDKINNLSTDELIRFNTYLKDNYSSYDGFVSFTSNNSLDVVNNVQNYDERDISAFLNWYIFDFLNEIDENDWIQYVNENISNYSEFINDNQIEMI